MEKQTWRAEVALDCTGEQSAAFFDLIDFDDFVLSWRPDEKCLQATGCLPSRSYQEQQSFSERCPNNKELGHQFRQPASQDTEAKATLSSEHPGPIEAPK